ncbi:MAG: serine hydrolase domain-containing protein [Gemmatimonadales bacterium]
MTSRRLAALLALVGVTHLPGQRPAPAASAWSAFTAAFDAYSDSDRIVGASVAWMQAGKVVAHHEYGLADRADGTPVTERTIYHYGSITKTLTAIAIMQLRDRGRLSLDDPIVRYVPELRRVHDAYGSIDSVSLRMLLAHTAGFQNPTWPYTDGKPWQPFEPTDWSQLVAMMPYQELLFKPGERYSYSNPGFIYLARVIEQLSGDPWETYVQKNVLSPLGLTRSYFGVTPYYLANDRSHNYYATHDSATGRDIVIDNGADFDPGVTIPNGGWNAPLADLETYLAFLTDASHGDTALQARYDLVLPHRDLEEMWRPFFSEVERAADSSSRGRTIETTGISFFVVWQDGVKFVGHTGSQAGFTAFIYLNPATSDAIVAAFNTEKIGGSGSRQSSFAAIRSLALKLIGGPARR